MFLTCFQHNIDFLTFCLQCLNTFSTRFQHRFFSCVTQLTVDICGICGRVCGHLPEQEKSAEEEKSTEKTAAEKTAAEKKSAAEEKSAAGRYYVPKSGAADAEVFSASRQSECRFVFGMSVFGGVDFRRGLY